MAQNILLKPSEIWTPVRTNSIANQIVMQVREALFEGRFKPGDQLGSEKELATQFNVSRITIRDALRTLETMGIIEIRVGAGGGARIAQGNLDCYSDALSIQFKLSGISEDEVLGLQIAIEGTAIELAAINRKQSDLAKLATLLTEAEKLLDKPSAFTQCGHQFHLAIVEASGNRALIAQFKAIHYVVWPKNAKRAGREISSHALGMHKKIFQVIKDRKPDKARKLMVAHLESIRAMIDPNNNMISEIRPVCC